MDNENIMMLTDEDGNEAEYELLSVIEYEGNQYAVFLSTEEEEEDVLILVLEEDEEGNECLGTVEDEDILQTIFDIFKEEEKDRFNFVD